MTGIEGASAGGRGVRPMPDGGHDPMDRILLALSEPRRRYLLYYLERQGDAYIEQASRFIAACEQDCEAGEVSEELASTVKRELYHVHLPKLSDENIIDYDRRSGAMCFLSPPAELSSFLELTSSMERSECEIEEL